LIALMPLGRLCNPHIELGQLLIPGIDQLPPAVERLWGEQHPLAVYGPPRSWSNFRGFCSWPVLSQLGWKRTRRCLCCLRGSSVFPKGLHSFSPLRSVPPPFKQMRDYSCAPFFLGVLDHLHESSVDAAWVSPQPIFASGCRAHTFFPRFHPTRTVTGFLSSFLPVYVLCPPGPLPLLTTHPRLSYDVAGCICFSLR